MVIKGQKYRHYKGNIYEVIAIAKHSETEELMVVYVDSSNSEKFWARPYHMFIEKLPDGISRFELV